MLIISIQTAAQSHKFKWILLDSFKMDSSMNHVSFSYSKYLDNVLEVKIACAKGSVTLGRVLIHDHGKVTLIDLSTPITPDNDFNITSWYGDKIRPSGLFFNYASSDASETVLLLLAKIKTY